MTLIPMSEARGELRRACLRRIDGEGEIDVHFNPSQLAISKTGTWTSTPTRGAATAPPPEFVGAQARTLELELTLDAPSTGRDVAADAELLQSWCNPTPRSIEAGTPQPPLVQLDWSTVAGFEAFIARVAVTYVLFDRDGAPLRASVRASLTESPTSARRQNPTSGGVPGHRSRVLQAGESLPSIAWSVYGDATLWRALARHNRVVDPLAITPGQRLDIPPVDTVRALAP